jgi:hypothetical protein
MLRRKQSEHWRLSKKSSGSRAHFRATGKGWHTRINDTRRKAARLKRAGGGR